MSRRKRSKKRLPGKDLLYDSCLVNLFILRILKSGKKKIAQKIVYQALSYIQEQTNEDGLVTLELAVTKVRPAVELKPRRVGGSIYQIPVEVKGIRSINLALRWLIKFSRDKAGKNMSIKLAREIMDAAKGLGNSIRRKEDVHRMAKANRAFSYLRNRQK